MIADLESGFSMLPANDTLPADATPEQKLDALERLLKSYGRIAIGFSGGVDSTFLAAVCSRTMPKDTLLVHLTTPFIGTPEQSSFEDSVEGHDAPALNLPVLNLSINQLDVPEVVPNDENRCYYCKRAGFTAITNHARSLGFKIVIDGSNASDVGDYRPGMRAVDELGVHSPLQEVGFTKDEEREFLRQWGFPVWNMPSGACLATRIPTGEPLSLEKVNLVRACEDYLHELGLVQVRARLIGGCLHLEAAPDDIKKLAALGGTPGDTEGGTFLPELIEAKLRELGCGHISHEVKPYVHGNMNA